MPGVTAAQGAIGEVVRYRLVTSVGEGLIRNFQIQDNLPAGLRFLNDSSARFGFITSSGTNLTSTGVTNISALSGGGVSGSESSLATLASAALTGVFGDGNVSTGAAGVGTGDAAIYASGQDVFFRFGDLTNADSDLNAEFVVIEFNALVENVAANQAGTILSNDYSVLVDTDGDGTTGYVSVLQDTDGDGTTSAGDTPSAANDPSNDGTGTPGVSNPATVTVAEPSLTIEKQVVATAGGGVTYRVTVTNAGGAAVSRANDLRVADTLDGTNLSLVAGSVGNFTVLGGAAGTFDPSNTAGNTIDARVTFLDAGSSFSFTYQANVLTTPTGGTTLDNTATVTATSLAGDNGDTPFFGTTSGTLGTPGTDTGERTGGGGINDYAASDTERLGSIGNRVWVDVNGDGVQDSGEPGIVGAPVAVRWAGPDGVFDNGDDSVINTTTGANGVYTVSGLPVDSPGAFRVTVNTAGAPFTTFGLNAQTFDADGTGTANLSERAITSATPNPRDQDFGYRGTASIGDRVWNDRDGDRAQDANEPSIPAATVTVTWHGQDGTIGGGDDVVYTTTTDANGNYSVGNLPAGDYTVAVDAITLPDNLTQTYDLDGVATAHAATTTLATGQNRTDVDFGYRGAASIGDRVWYDVDGDGTQDAGEPGIAGVTVTLLYGGDDGDLSTAADNIIYTATTDANGNYLFDGIPGGDVNGGNPNYRVTVAQPAGYTDRTFDADGTGTANQSELQLGATETNLGQDFGYRGPASRGWATSCGKT